MSGMSIGFDIASRILMIFALIASQPYRRGLELSDKRGRYRTFAPAKEVSDGDARRISRRTSGSRSWRACSWRVSLCPRRIQAACGAC